MPYCFRWRISHFGAASTAWSSVCASLSLPCPVRRPAVAMGRVPRDQVVRCLSAGGAEFRVLASWGPLLVPGSLYSSATEILSFFLESFEVVVEWFSSSHCWSLLHWRHLSVFRPASAGDRYLSGLRAGDCVLPLRRRIHARVWMVACLPLLREWQTATSHVPSMLCASNQNLFLVNPGLF